MQGALIIFIKNPVIGKCKTRLAKSIGDKKALAVYNSLLDYTRSVALSVDCALYLYYDQFIDNHDAWEESHFNKRLQISGHLGERMSQAFEEVLSQHNKAVIIGSDCPEINASHINKALSILDQKDVVIGPSHDGGYYLLAMADYFSGLFENIAWSTESVLPSTLSRAKALGLDYALIDTLSDLDDLNDLRRFPEFNI